MYANARPPAMQAGGPRSCYMDNGKPKMQFRSGREARAYRRKLGIDSNQYRCQSCDYWHLTSGRQR